MNQNLVNFLKLFANYRKNLLISFLALIATALAILAFGKNFSNLIDFGIKNSNILFLLANLLFFLCLVVVISVAGYYRSLILNNLAENVSCHLQKKIYSNLIFSSIENLQNKQIGQIINNLTTNIANIKNFISNNFPFLIRNLILFFGSIFSLILISLKLTAIIFLLISLTIIPIIFLGKKIKNLSNNLNQINEKICCQIEETIQAVKLIKSHLGEEKELIKFANLTNQNLQITQNKNHFKALIIAIAIAIAFGSIAFIIYFGAILVIGNNLSSGQLSSFVFYSVILSISN